MCENLSQVGGRPLGNPPDRTELGTFQHPSIPLQMYRANSTHALMLHVQTTIHTVSCLAFLQDRAHAAEEKAQLTEAVMKDKTQAAKAMAERASARHTAAEERASRLETELAAALESAAAEARLAQRQVPAEACSIRTLSCT